MGIFGNSAVLAVKLFTEKKLTDPSDAWVQAINTMTKSQSVKKKNCPKSAFLALCETGWIHGIPKGSYTGSEKNKKYAISAIEILRKTPTINNCNDLWEQVVRETQVHNSQMDVVLSLWRNGLVTR